MPNEVTLAEADRGGLLVYPIDAVRAFGLDAFVTSRRGGVSPAPYDSLNLGDHVGDEPRHVEENRRRVARALGAERLVTVRQVHGAEVLEARSATPESQADAIFERADGLALAVLVADCVPLLMVDDDTHDFCLVHAGWRGLRAGVIANAVARFSDPGHVRAVLGPCISQDAYQVGPEVARHFSDVPAALVPDGGDRSRLDLRRIAEFRLEACGVLDRHVTRTRQVTDGGRLFFSDRAERPCGRFGLVAKRVF